MNGLNLKFKDQGLKATNFYTLTVKLFTVFYWRSFRTCSKTGRCSSPPPYLPPQGGGNLVLRSSLFAFIGVFLFFSPAYANQPDIRDLERIRDENLVGIMHVLKKGHGGKGWGSGKLLKQYEDRLRAKVANDG